MLYKKEELIMGFLDLFKNKNNKLKQNTLAYVLADCKKFKIDTIIMFTAKTCNYCSKYGRKRNGGGKIYSISGKSKKYPALSTIPSDLLLGRCPKCDKTISFNTYYPELEDLDKPFSDKEIAELDRQRKKK